VPEYCVRHQRGRSTGFIGQRFKTRCEGETRCMAALVQAYSTSTLAYVSPMQFEGTASRGKVTLY
jgi:hypothetical protein